MNAPTKSEAVKLSPLELLRQPFPDHQISKLPKPTKAQTQAVKDDFKKGIRCQVCGSWHHPDVIHLDYVGHAALTDRLLDSDIAWYWEPMAYREGLPAFDHTGGLWIKLTVAGVTRLGYGNAELKPGIDIGAREKEVIGDALRNAAMRFGAALDLWHKGDLHVPDETPASPPENALKRLSSAQAKERGLDKEINDALAGCTTRMELAEWDRSFDVHTAQLPLSWLDALRNKVILRGEEIDAEQGADELDQAFRETVRA